LTGKVIWVNYKQSTAKPQGFAIQLTGEKALIISLRLKSYWRVVCRSIIQVIPFNRSSCVYRYALPPDHVEFSTYAGDLDQALQEARDAGVTKFMGISVTLDDHWL